MFTTGRLGGMLRVAGPSALIAALAAGCVTAGSSATTAATTGAGSTATAAAGDSSGMAGMDMGSTPAATSSAAADSEANAAGIKPVPTQVLGTAVWQGMKITAMAMTA